MISNNIIIGLLFSLFAGIFTSVGAAIAFLSGSRGGNFLSFGLGLSAGVMVYVSFVEILKYSGENSGEWFSLFAFLGGVVLTAIIDRMIPDAKNPHEARTEKSLRNLKVNTEHKNRKLMRTGILTAIAITIHNFPEGFATFATAITDVKMGLSIAIAVAIHNIPEGISVSVPIYAATNNKKTAFIYSSLSGLTEPIGAFLGWLFLAPFITQFTLGIVMGVVAGIMIYISFDELLPTAREYGEGHIEITGVITGMAIMSISLNLL